MTAAGGAVTGETRLRVVGRGDPTLRPRHHKSAELLIDAGAAAERQSCVVGVRSRYERTPSRPLRGALRVTVECGAVTGEFTGYANPDWSPGGHLVLRRGSLALPGTLATDCDLTAKAMSDLFGDRLADADATFVWTFEEVPHRTVPEVCLALVDPGVGVDDVLAVELAAADAVVAEDAVTRDLFWRAGPPAPVGADALDGEPRRVLVAGSSRLPGETVGALLGLARVAVETRHVPAFLAPAAAAPSSAALRVTADRRMSARRLRGLVTGTEPSRVVFSCPGSEVTALAESLAGDAIGLCAAPAFGRPVTVTAGWEPTPRDARHFACAYPASTPPAEPGRPGFLDDVPTSLALSAVLSAGTISVRDVAAAVSRATGLPRNEVYRALLALRRSEGPERPGTADGPATT